MHNSESVGVVTGLRMLRATLVPFVYGSQVRLCCSYLFSILLCLSPVHLLLCGNFFEFHGCTCSPLRRSAIGGTCACWRSCVLWDSWLRAERSPWSTRWKRCAIADTESYSIFLHCVSLSVGGGCTFVTLFQPMADRLCSEGGIHP